MKKTKPEPKPRIQPGPKADRLKIAENWQKAIKKTLAKKKPASGWPQ